MQNQQQQPQQRANLLDQILGMRGVAYMASLIVLPFIRRDFGARALDPIGIALVSVILFFIGGLSIHTPNNGSILLLAGLVLAFGNFQRLLAKFKDRWMKNRHVHSYHLGTSLFEHPRLPRFIIKNRLCPRLLDPLLCVGVGIAFMEYCSTLGVIIFFAGIALLNLELEIQRIIREREWDIKDNLIVAENYARAVEELSHRSVPPTLKQQTSAIATGLDKDLEDKVQKHSANN